MGLKSRLCTGNWCCVSKELNQSVWVRGSHFYRPLFFLLVITECDRPQHWFPKLRRRKCVKHKDLPVLSLFKPQAVVFLMLIWRAFRYRWPCYCPISWHRSETMCCLTLLIDCSDAAAPPAAAAAPAALAIFPLSSASWWEGAVNTKWAFAVK